MKSFLEFITEAVTNSQTSTGLSIGGARPEPVRTKRYQTGAGAMLNPTIPNRGSGIPKATTDRQRSTGLSIGGARPEPIRSKTYQTGAGAMLNPTIPNRGSGTSSSVKPPIPKARPAGLKRSASAAPPIPKAKPANLNTNTGAKPSVSKPKKLIKPKTSQSFGQAFAGARKSGKKVFVYKGKSYNTKLKKS